MIEIASHRLEASAAPRALRTALLAACAMEMASCASTVGRDVADGRAADTDVSSSIDGSAALDATDSPMLSDVCERETFEPAFCWSGATSLDCTLASSGTVNLSCGIGGGCCVVPCTSAADCDPCTPYCVTGGCNSVQHCWPEPRSCGCAICAAEHTSIATPFGERAIETIAEGDVVFGSRNHDLAPVRVIRVARTRVWHHSMVHVVLRGGRVVEMSAGHPTFEATPFGSLRVGDDLGGEMIERVDVVPYEGQYTYDLLTDGDRGAYVAAGVLIGSTLRP